MSDLVFYILSEFKLKIELRFAKSNIEVMGHQFDRSQAKYNITIGAKLSAL
jgi:hypothetical protein